jgi:hypothetical protein
MFTEFWWQNLRETDNSEYLGVDGRIKLKWILMEWDAGHVPDLYDTK